MSLVSLLKPISVVPVLLQLVSCVFIILIVFYHERGNVTAPIQPTAPTTRSIVGSRTSAPEYTVYLTRRPPESTKSPYSSPERA